MLLEIFYLLLFLSALALASKLSNEKTKNRELEYKISNLNKKLNENSINKHVTKKYTTDSNAIKVVGVTYTNEIGGSRQKIINDLQNGDYVYAMLDPKNKYDANAIRLVSNMGCIGFFEKNSIEINKNLKYANKYFIIKKLESNDNVGVRLYQKNISYSRFYFDNICYISILKGILTHAGSNVASIFMENDILIEHVKFGLGNVFSVNERLKNGLYYNVKHLDLSEYEDVKKYAYDLFISDKIAHVYIKEDRLELYLNLPVEDYSNIL